MKKIKKMNKSIAMVLAALLAVSSIDAKAYASEYEEVYESTEDNIYDQSDFDAYIETDEGINATREDEDVIWSYESDSNSSELGEAYDNDAETDLSESEYPESDITEADSEGGSTPEEDIFETDEEYDINQEDAEEYIEDITEAFTEEGEIDPLDDDTVEAEGEPILVSDSIPEDEGTPIISIDYNGLVDEDGYLVDSTKELSFELSYNDIAGRPGEDYSKYYRISEVSYSIAGGVKVHLDGYNGEYAINPANITGDVNITVEVTKIYFLHVKEASGAGITGNEHALERVNIVCKADGSVIAPIDSILSEEGSYYITEYIYEIPEESEVSAAIDQKSQCELKKVTIQKEDSVDSRTVPVSKGKSLITLSQMDADYTISVEAVSMYKNTVIITQQESELPVNSRKTYSVRANNEILFVPLNGDDTTKEYGHIELVDRVDADVADIITDGEGTQLLAVYGKAAGKTLKVRIYDETDSKILDTIVFNVIPAVKKATINGSKSKTISGEKVTVLYQEADTTVVYKIKKDKTSSQDKLVLSPGSINEREYDYGKARAVISEDGNTITITTDVDSIDEEYPLTIYNSSMSNMEVCNCSIIINSPAWVKNAPTVKVINTTDISAVLSLKLPKGLNPALGNIDNYYYRIEATPVSTTPEAIPFNIQYVKATESEYLMKLLRLDAGKSNRPFYFNITAQMVMVDASQLPDNPTYNDYSHALIKEGKEVTINNVATKIPAYENNFTLTKKNTKFYSNQKNVIVACPKYSKATTYIEADRVSIVSVKNVAGINILDKEIDMYVDSSGNIRANACYSSGMAELPTPAGTYTVYVKYDRDPADEPLYTSTQIEIVQSITSLSITAPERLYKVTGRKASVTPSIQYNNGKSTPYSKKVNWSLEPSGAALRGVTINSKSGAVTVPAGYVLSGIAADNIIKIKAVAADYEGNSVETVKSMQIVDKQTVIKSVKLVSSTNSSLQIYNGGIITTNDYFNVNAYYDAEMTNVSRINPSLYDIKVSGSLELVDGKVHVKKQGSGTVTVIASDGAKSSVSMNIVASYYEESLNIMTYNYDAMPKTNPKNPADVMAATYDIIKKPGSYKYDNNFISDKSIMVALREINELTNVTFNLSGGIELFRMETGICFVPTSELSTVTVVNNITREKYVIKYINKALNPYLNDARVLRPGSLYSGERTTSARPTLMITADNLDAQKDYKAYITFPAGRYHPLLNYTNGIQQMQDGTQVIEYKVGSTETGVVYMPLYLAAQKGPGETYTTNYTSGSYRINVQFYEKVTDDTGTHYVPATIMKTVVLEVYQE